MIRLRLGSERRRGVYSDRDRNRGLVRPLTIIRHASGIMPTEFPWWTHVAGLLEPEEAPVGSQAVENEADFLSAPEFRLDSRGLSWVDPLKGVSLHLSTEPITRRAERTSHLCRAVGIGSGVRRKTVLDAFAGFGTDGLALAQHCEVTLVEANPVVFVLLAEISCRSGHDVELLHADCWPLLEQNSMRWDVIYLDPMFPRRNKRALPNKAMQQLKEMTQEMKEANIEQLLAVAQQASRERVVLKRRLRDPVMGRPNHSLKGRSVRFDVYLS